nr:hypothetical protein GCM10020063_085420 [Dactylosporangium thailandense]
MALAVLATLLVVVAAPRESAAAAGTKAAGVAVSLSADPIAAGQLATATAVVTAADAADGVPTGTVRFTVDGANFGSAVSLVGGQGAVVLENLPVGSHAVSATYSGDATFAASDAGPGLTEVVVPAGTASFVPVTPARVLDTRPGRLNGYTGDKPAAGGTVTLQIAGRGGVPATGATAVVLNVTATQAESSGYVTVWPSDRPRPVASNLNLETVGQTIPNLVVVPLSASGTVNIFTWPSTHLIADVSGYFAPATSSAQGRFVALNPSRLLDTRNGNGYTGPKPAADATVKLAVAGRGGVPASGAAGVVLNVTMTGADSGGYVTVWPSDRPRPVASNLNATHDNQTIANAVWVPLAPDGTVSLYTYSATHLVVDVAGWFTGPDMTVSTAGLFVPTQPTRLLDTRGGPNQTGYTGSKPAAGATLPLVTAGRGPVPATGAAAVVTNVTATESTGDGYVTAYATGQARPLASNLNLETAGQTRPNLVTTPLGAGSIDLYTSVSTHLIADVAGYFTADLDPAPAPSQHATVTPASGTAVLDPTAVRAVTGDAANGYRLTLAPGGSVPAVGQNILLKGGGDAYPDGLAAKVTAHTPNSDGTTSVTAGAVPVDQVVNNLDLGYDGAAQVAVETVTGTTGARAAGTVRAADVSAERDFDRSKLLFESSAWTCSGATGFTPSVAAVRFDNTKVHFEKRVGLFVAPYVSFYLMTEPIVEFSGEVHGKVSCELSAAFRRSHRIVWRLPTEVPVTVDLAPALKFEATVAGTVSFTEHFYRMVGIRTNPDLSIHVINAASQRPESVDVSAGASVSLLIGADMSLKVLDVAGLGVTLGPQFVASVDTHLCASLKVSIKAEFDIRLDLIIKEFRKSLVTLGVGPWTLWRRCASDGGGGGTDPLTVASTSLPSGTAGTGYSASLLADGGAAPYTWQVSGLPAGLTADAAGHIGGTPAAPSWSQLTVKVTDHSGATATEFVTLSIGRVLPAEASLLSASPSGAPGNAPSSNAQVSGDGAYVYFESSATNLTADGIGRSPAVYLRDVAAGTTRRLDIPGDDGSINRLKGVSSNGRFALLQTNNSHDTGWWRYDRVTATFTAIAPNVYSPGPGEISDDGGLVDLGGSLYRISDGTGIEMPCPGATRPGPFYPRITFVGNANVVYYIDDACGEYQYSAFRFDRTAGTTTEVLKANCYFNGGNACVSEVAPTLDDAHRAITVIANGPSTWSERLLLDGVQAGPVTGDSIGLCGITDSGGSVFYSTNSDLLTGGTTGGRDIFRFDRATNQVTRVSPIGSGDGGSSWCTRHALTGGGRLVYQYNDQIYLR